MPTTPILCQLYRRCQRASAYGLMNMTGVFAGAVITELLGNWAKEGNLGLGFSLMAAVLGCGFAASVVRSASQDRQYGIIRSY